MVAKRIPNVVAAAVAFLSVGAMVNISAATVWVQSLQLEQYWTGGQWKDSTSDTSVWLDGNSVASTIHAVNSNPNGLIDNSVTLNQYDADKELIQQVQQTYDKAQGEWADAIAGTKWTRYKDNNKHDTSIERQIYQTSDKENGISQQNQDTTISIMA